MTLSVTESGCLYYNKRPEAVLETGAIIAHLDLDDASRVQRAQLFLGRFRDGESPLPVAMAAMEVYVRRSYTSYELNCLQHKELSDYLCVVHFEASFSRQPRVSVLLCLLRCCAVMLGYVCFIHLMLLLLFCLLLQFLLPSSHPNRIPHNKANPTLSHIPSFDEVSNLIDLPTDLENCQRTGCMGAFSRLEDFEKYFMEIMEVFDESLPSSPGTPENEGSDDDSGLLSQSVTISNSIPEHSFMHMAKLKVPTILHYYCFTFLV